MRGGGRESSAARALLDTPLWLMALFDTRAGGHTRCELVHRTYPGSSNLQALTSRDP